MARKTFFSFHYERDAWRASQVRNCDLIPNEDEYGFIDAVDWESIKRQGDDAIRQWIKDQLKDTSATVVLVGPETAERPWVHYEILESWNRGNGLVGVSIHNVKDQNRATEIKGQNPFDSFKLPNGTLLSEITKIYDWVADDGRNNLGTWIEEAYEIRAGYQLDEKIVEEEKRHPRTEQPRSIHTPSAVGFRPQSPWCPNDVEK